MSMKTSPLLSPRPFSIDNIIDELDITFANKDNSWDLGEEEINEFNEDE